jgi:hypothetical protein
MADIDPNIDGDIALARGHLKQQLRAAGVSGNVPDTLADVVLDRAAADETFAGRWANRVYDSQAVFDGIRDVAHNPGTKAFLRECGLHVSPDLDPGEPDSGAVSRMSDRAFKEYLRKSADKARGEKVDWTR